MRFPLKYSTVGDIETAKLLLDLGAKSILNKLDSSMRPPGAYAELHDQYDFQDWMATLGAQVQQVLDWEDRSTQCGEGCGMNWGYEYGSPCVVYATVATVW